MKYVQLKVLTAVLTIAATWFCFPCQITSHALEMEGRQSFGVNLIPDLYGDSDVIATKVNPTAVPEVIPMTEEELQEELYYDSLETLAICIEAEAGTEDLDGKRLVADVILNRVDDPRYPNDINSVVYQKLGDVYMFSTAGDGAMDAVIEPSEETFRAIQMELDKEHRLNSEILYFTAGEYNEYCAPMFKHGKHYFGKSKNELWP